MVNKKIDEELMIKALKDLKKVRYIPEYNCLEKGHEWKVINEIDTKKRGIFGSYFEKIYIQKCKHCGVLHSLNIKLGNWTEEKVKETIKQWDG